MAAVLRGHRFRLRHVRFRSDKAKRGDGTFSRADFLYDKERDLYICPGAQLLKTTGRLHSDNIYRYIARKHDCDACALKSRCCPNTPARRVPRDRNEEARDHTRALMETEDYGLSIGQRKRIEALFGEAKNILSMVRLRLRGLTGARDEFLLTATVQNLKRLASHTARPPPEPMIA